MIALACDHSAVELKEEIKKVLDARGLSYEDFGTNSTDSCHYPIFGARAAKAVADGRCELGIVICGTGIGISLAANKVKGIRCALCSDTFSARLTRLHNNANVLCIGARVVGAGLGIDLVNEFINAEFEGDRHIKRLSLIEDIENGKEF